MREPDHRKVADWLRRFDVAAVTIAEPRRSALRRELHSHLTDAIPLDADDFFAELQLEEFGRPEMIVSNELSGAVDTSKAHRSGGSSLFARTIPWAAAGVGAATLLIGGAALWMTGATPSAMVPEESSADSVVTERPMGPERVESGQPFEQYRRALGELPPLPRSAAWPIGVPEALTAGAGDDGTAEVGQGEATAHFTWLCAWEWEYLDAERDADDARLVAALAELEAWAESEWWSQRDPDGEWEASVIEPLRFGDSRPLRQSFPETCALAGIVNVAASISADSCKSTSPGASRSSEASQPCPRTLSALSRQVPGVTLRARVDPG